MIGKRWEKRQSQKFRGQRVANLKVVLKSMVGHFDM